MTLTFTKLTMGISAQQHRVCTGLFNNVKFVRPVRCHVSPSTCLLDLVVNAPCIVVVSLAIYFYILIYIMFMCADCAVPTQSYVTYYPAKDLIIMSIRPYLNLWFLFLTFTLIDIRLRKYLMSGDCINFYTTFKDLVLKVYRKRYHTDTSYFRKFIIIALDGLAVFLFLLNISLIVICNPSLLNPGPKPFSVFYNNVQGFISTHWSGVSRICISKGKEVRTIIRNKGSGPPRPDLKR